MNLFFLTWNFPLETRIAARDELTKMRKIFSHLDEQTISVFGGTSPVFAVCMTNSPAVCSPRQYVSQSETGFTFFDGCLVDMKGEIAAHRADHLASNWKVLEGRIEGHFFVAKMDSLIPQLEIKNDYLGFYPVFYRRMGNAWLMSNSVHLINNIAGRKGFDPIGISMFAGFGWAGGDRTLDSEVRVLPGGQHWIFSENEIEPVKKTYFSRRSLAVKNSDNSKSTITTLGDELSSMLSLVNQNYRGLINAPITAGKDSRLIASVLLKNKIDAMFFTICDPNSIDGKIGVQIARCLGLKHKLDQDPVKEEVIVNNWDRATQRMLNFTDGMVTLAHIANIVKPPETVEVLNVQLYGGGGEIGRKWFENTIFYFLNGHGKEYLRNILRKTCIRSSELILPEARAICRKHIDSFIDEALEDGFSIANIPAVFCAYELIRRWGGANYRQIVSYSDVFAPFCSQPYVRAALSISPIQRYSDALHYGIAKRYTPELFSIPLECEWKPQSKWANYAELLVAPILSRIRAQIKGRLMLKTCRQTIVPNREEERRSWFEAQLATIREHCLDKKLSPVWEAIDRNKFDQLTRLNGSPDERKRNIKVLYDAVTVLYYCN